jgi:hypothetical protein
MRFYAITIGEKDPDFGSSFIQWGLSLIHKKKVNKSHACILVEDGGKWSGVWESMGDGFHGPKDPEKSFAKGIVRDKILLDVEDPLEAIEWLREFLGTPYARAQYLQFLPEKFRRIAKHFVPRFIMKMIVNGKWLSFCSESVAHFIRCNCRWAYEDPDLQPIACDRIDPFKITAIAKRYEKKILV